MSNFKSIGGEFDDKWGEKRDAYTNMAQEHAEKISRYIAEQKEAALWHIFLKYFNLTTIAQIQNFKRAHKCQWHVERDGNRERFRIDGKYYWQINVVVEGRRFDVESEFFDPPLSVQSNILLACASGSN